ncbi:hypothetical protein MF625_001000 [Paenibacillus polymyxa]|uniref:hypothetical protein n=1 Tax=Paenibacillus polymyxa TaxID=1406 RepID=UPI00202471A2|nr:hypothetical protein [Paenibacillus polymyxa]URJ36582.1 hypothetical protein MF625_001000 [Paenibacillus polymyxa]
MKNIDMLDMTDQQLNLALAELVYNARECRRDTDSRVVIIGDFGTYNTHPLTGDWKKAKWRDTPEEAWEDIPNYCNDPATSLEVQAAACEVHPNTYIRYLEKIKWGQSTGWKVSNRVVAQLCNASPRERAEAAFMTLSDRD